MRDQTSVLVVTRMWPSPERPHFGSFVKDEVAALRRLGLHCGVVSTPVRGIHGYAVLWREMRRALARSSYEIVHAHYVFAGLVALMQRRARVVVTFHGSDLLGRRGLGFRERVLGYVEAHLSRLVARRADAAVVVSEEMARRLEGIETFVVTAGVDLDRFRPLDQEHCRHELGLKSRSRYVLFLGNPSLPVKRYALAEQAVAALSRSEVALVPIFDRDHVEIPLWLNAADVLLLTSEQEGSPMAVKEALACNLPVVAVPVGDVSERLAGVENCRVAGPTPSQIADALADVLASMGRSDGRSRAEEWSLDASARRLLQVYEAAA